MLKQTVLTRLLEEFRRFAREEGRLPETLMISVPEYVWRTPTGGYPPGPPRKELVRELNRRFRVVLPRLELNQALMDAASASPEMQSDYIGQIADAIAEDVEFVEEAIW